MSDSICAATATTFASAITLFLLVAFTSGAEAQEPFRLGSISAAPGTIASGELRVPARPGDEGTTIPVSVIHGARPGPVLALTAGVHGQEYTPILALQRVVRDLDPKSLSGTLILVHVANMPSFLRRTIYYSPVDGHNLNRVFPGRPDGTLSERIAHTITINDPKTAPRQIVGACLGGSAN